MKLLKKARNVVLASVIAAINLVGPNAVLAESFVSSQAIVPHMGNERVVVNGDVIVQNMHTFGSFSLKNPALKVSFRGGERDSSFSLDLMYYSAGVNEDVIDGTLQFKVTSDDLVTKYMENVKIGQNNSLRIRGTAWGKVTAYDWGPNL